MKRKEKFFCGGWRADGRGTKLAARRPQTASPRQPVPPCNHLSSKYPVPNDKPPVPPPTLFRLRNCLRCCKLFGCMHPKPFQIQTLIRSASHGKYHQIGGKLLYLCLRADFFSQGIGNVFRKLWLPGIVGSGTPFEMFFSICTLFLVNPVTFAQFNSFTPAFSM